MQLIAFMTASEKTTVEPIVAGHITGVLPLVLGEYRGGRDVERAEILLRSLERFDKSNILDPILIIVDRYDCGAFDRLLARAGRKTLLFMHEDEVEPHLGRVRGLHGWKKQQILKLAISAFVDTPFYLTLDSDIVCAKPLVYINLILDGRGLVQFDGKCGLASAFNRPSWWSAAARVLDTSPGFSDPGVAVTPFLIARDACARLISHIAALSGVEVSQWIAGLFNPGAIDGIEDFDFAACGWTEYSLYHLFLVKHQAFNSYHFTSAKGVQLLSRNSFGFIWTDGSFEQWSARVCFGDEDPALFFAVQSRSLVPITQIRKKLRPYFPAC